MTDRSTEHVVPFEEVDRRAQLQAEIQQCRVEMVYGSLLERRRLQRQITRAEMEICRMIASAVHPGDDQALTRRPAS
jgi:hypothetical protein